MSGAGGAFSLSLSLSLAVLMFSLSSPDLYHLLVAGTHTQDSHTLVPTGVGMRK